MRSVTGSPGRPGVRLQTAPESFGAGNIEVRLATAPRSGVSDGASGAPDESAAAARRRRSRLCGLGWAHLASSGGITRLSIWAVAPADRRFASPRPKELVTVKDRGTDAVRAQGPSLQRWRGRGFDPHSCRLIPFTLRARPRRSFRRVAA